MKKESVIVIKAIIKIKNWITFFRIHSGNLKKGYHKITLRNGIIFLIRGNAFDAGIIREVAIQDYYHLDKIKKGDIVVDIGGSIGAFSILAANRAEKVFVYEPFPDNYNIIKKNLELNRLKNVKPFKSAVYKRAGKIKLFVEKENLGGHSVCGNSKNSIEIKTTTLKRIFLENRLQHIDLLKMDCEGAEYDILLSTPKDYCKKINRIVMEHHEVKGHDVKELKQFLEQNGFIVIVDRFMLYATNRNFK